MGRHVSLLVALLVAMAVSATPGTGQVTDPTAQPPPPDLAPAIDEIVAPLAHAPAILEVGQPLVVEVDPAAHDGDPATTRARLTQSFAVDGDPAATALVPPTSVATSVESDLWPGRVVTRLVYEVDAGEGLFDLTIAWGQEDPSGLLDGPTDTQRRAVRFSEDIHEAPTVAILADPSIGDPRPLQEGVTETLPPGLPYPPDTDGDPLALPPKLFGVTGNPAEEEERWAALNAAIDEINLVRPDFVLLAGDVTFAAHPRAYPYEYAEAYRVLDRLRVPSFASPGNHDLYALDYDRYPEQGDPTGGAGLSATDREHTADGLAEWQRWFGPLHYSVDIGPDFHLVSLNTFDWDDARPFPPPEFDTLSGGNVRQAQLDWLIDDLAAYRGTNPDGALVTFAHHDPSWLARRHPWPDYDNRNTVRELMAGFDVWAHFAGHTHEDRVARYHQGSIAETNGRQHLASDYPLGKLHYLDINVGDLDCAFSARQQCQDNPHATILGQQELAEIIRDPAHGPLFVTTTTAASGLIGEDWGLGGYWGWRLAELVPQPDGGYDSADMGYAADADPADVRAFLDARAERPERWNEHHAALGVFSVPTGGLRAEQNANGTIAVTNELLQPVSVTLPGRGGERRITVPADSVRTVGG